MPNFMIDDPLLMTIIAGMGLSGVYLKAEYALQVRSKRAKGKPCRKIRTTPCHWRFATVSKL